MGRVTLGFRRIQQMMHGQKVTESSITKSGPMLGVPGKTPDMETIFEANAA